MDSPTSSRPASFQEWPSPLADLNAYPYQPLDTTTYSFRLLELKPGQWSDPIECTLHDSSLEDEPVYDALSYVWGSTEDRRPIRVDGIQMLVTANLEIALRYIRLETAPTTIWVDALCIDQDDIYEKSSQVGLLLAIFSHARLVIAWTGEASEDSDEALATIRELAARLDNASIRPACDAPGRGYAALKEQASALGHLPGLESGSQRWRPWGSFIGREYWKRAWILQELACRIVPGGEWKPCEVRCGRSSISLLQLVNVFDAAVVRWHLPATSIEEMRGDVFPLAEKGQLTELEQSYVNMLSLLAKMHQSFSLLRLLVVTRDLVASDDRDKLFSILGLAPPEDRTAVQVDYSKTVAEVMADTVEGLVKNKRSVQDLFSDRRCVCPVAPSWTPEIHWYHGSTAPYNQGHLAIHRKAGGDGDFKAEFFKIPGMPDEGGHGRVMRLRGIVAGIVDDVLLRDRDKHTVEELLPNAVEPDLLTPDDWDEKLSSMARERWKYGLEAYDQFWRTLVFDISYDLESEVIHCPASDDFAQQSRYFFGLEDIPPNFHPEESLSNRRALISPGFLHFIRSLMSRRSLFSVSLGDSRLALGPHNIQLGDIVAVIPGLNPCLVLRRRKRENGGDMDGYVVVGVAYVHGIMAGELMGRSDIPEAVFDLY